MTDHPVSLIFYSIIAAGVAVAILINALRSPYLADKLNLWQPIYIRVYRNRVVAKYLKTGISAERRASPPFSTPRSLVGDFTSAQGAVISAVREVAPRTFWAAYRRVVVHPCEMAEGGLSQVEVRIMRELGYSVVPGAARDICIVEGARELTDAECIAVLKGANPSRAAA